MYIISLTYQVDISVIDSLLDEHSGWLNENFDRGNFLASGRKVPRTGGAILASGSLDRTALDGILAEDPFARSGAASYEVIELAVSHTADGLEKLADS